MDKDLEKAKMLAQLAMYAANYQLNIFELQRIHIDHNIEYDCHDGKVINMRRLVDD